MVLQIAARHWWVFLVRGMLAILFGERERWVPELLTGVAGIAIGFITFLWPDVTALVLMYLIASWAIVLGVFQIGGAIQLRREIEGEWALGLAGLGSVVFGAVVFLFPGDGAVALNWAVGLFAILFGLLLVALAFRLRALGERFQR